MKMLPHYMTRKTGSHLLWVSFLFYFGTGPLLAQACLDPLVGGFGSGAGQIIPFTTAYYTSEANASGDRLVVGFMPSGTLDLFALPSAPDQTYCGQVELAPGLFADAYVPTAAERVGIFSDFDGLLLDPFDPFAPFPGGIIMPPLPPGGVFAWRIAPTTAAEAIFDDPNLENEVRNALGIGPTDPLTLTAVQTLSSLVANNANIQSLGGD